MHHLEWRYSKEECGHSEETSEGHTFVKAMRGKKDIYKKHRTKKQRIISNFSLETKR